MLLLFFGGFVDSIAGGGGIITLPAYFASGLPPHLALGTNKFSGFMGTLFASIKYIRSGAINLRVAIISTLSSILGSAIGAKIATILNANIINKIILFLTPAVLIFFLFNDFIRSEKEKIALSRTKVLFFSILIGLLIGIYDGLFGPGTGTFMTIAFNILLGLDLLTAAGNARLCNLGSNLGSVIVFLINNKVLFPLAIFTALCGIAGNIIGSNFAIKKGAIIIKPLISLVMILLLIKIITDLY